MIRETGEFDGFREPHAEYPKAMSDQYTEISSQGFFSRLLNSLLGTLVGILFLVGSVVVLFWNEGRAVQAARALSSGQRQVTEANVGTVNAALDGTLVHATDTLSAAAGARDPTFRVGDNNWVRLRRKVEMFQWQEQRRSNSHESVGGTKTTEVAYEYHTAWAENPNDSSHFRHPEGHENPPMPLRGEIFNGREIRLGTYRVSDTVLETISAFQPISVDGSATEPAGYRREGGGFYRGAGNPAAPAVGDVRVTFSGVAQQTVSIVAGVSSGTLDAYRATNGYQIAVGKPGVVPASALFEGVKHQEDLRTWIFRGVGWMLMLFGFVLVGGPVVTLLAFLPLLEGMAQAGVFLIAVTLSIPLTLLTIAVAWFGHRPLLSLALGVGAAVVFLLLRIAHPKAPQPPSTAIQA